MSDTNQDQAPSPEFTPNSEYPVEEVHESSPTGLKVALAVMIVLAGIAALYGWQEHQAAEQIAAERAELRTSLTQVKGQEESLTARLNELSAAREQEQAARAQAEAEAAARVHAAAEAQLVAHRRARAVAARSATVEDQRFKQLQTQLGEQQKQLADSQQQIAKTQANLKQARSELEANLESTRTGLTGDIARNHAELVALEKKGERSYFEFSVEKSKIYHHTGPISIALRKADTKHASCDLQMLIDDQEISRKHVNLYESLNFYPQGYNSALEVVINHISKDTIQGYVSVPKSQAARQAASATPTTPEASVTSATTATPIAVDTVAKAQGQPETRAQ